MVLAAIITACVIWTALLRWIVAPPEPWVTPRPERALPAPTAAGAITETPGPAYRPEAPREMAR
jgi:hypothetical protein